MNVAVLDTQAVFSRGPDERLADRLCEALRDSGHGAELVRIPFDDVAHETIVDQMLAVRLVVLSNVDRMIGLRFPAYYARHDDKVVWLGHGGDVQAAALPNTASGRAVRRAVQAAEHAYLGEARRIYARSPTARECLGRAAGLACGLLSTPSGGPDEPDAIAWAGVVAELTR